jgi:hypothetical protein
MDKKPQIILPQTMRQHHDATLQALTTEMSSWKGHWQELQQYVLPRRGRFLDTDVNKGTKRNTNIIDNTATLAARTLASGMMAGITSPARPWFRLAPPDPEMRDYAPVRRWLDQVDLILREIFARSNFYNAMHVGYGELGTFGQAPIYIQKDFKDVIRCFPFTIGSYMMALDERLTVNTLYREVPMTVSQVVRMFGLEKCTTDTQQMYGNGQYNEWLTVYHAIEPNTDRQYGMKDDQNMEYRSCYWEKGSNQDQYLRKSGYQTFPIMAPRWDVLGSDVYGRSPGMDALGDSKQLQVQHREKGKGIAKQVNPPMTADATMEGKPTNTLPGGVTYAPNPGAGFVQSQQINIDLSGLKEDIYETQQRIKRAFYEDLFLMLAQSDRREITAREVEEKHEEKLLMLGPVMERLNDELLDPAIDRTFNIAAEAGILPDPPKELEGAELGVEYISIMAQAQKLVGTGGLERLAGFTGNLAQFKPEVLDKINGDEMIDEYADMLGVPAKVVNSAEEVDATRKAAAQKQQMQENMMMAEQAAQTGKTASEIDVGDGENLVSKILGNGVPGGTGGG